MPARKRALAAVGFAVLALLSTIPFWTALLIERPNLGLRDMSDFFVTYVVKMSAGAAVNVLVIGLLAIPVLTGHGLRHLQALAVLGAIGVASLFFLYDSFWFGAVLALSSFPNSGTSIWWQLAAVTGMLAAPVSVGFAIATAVGSRHPRRGRFEIT